MNVKSSYSIHTDVNFNPLELIDIRRLYEECKEDWYNQSLCRVNDCVIRLGVLKGEFHWHKHADEDEFFYVISGRLLIDVKDRTIELKEQQGFTVPKGIIHRTRAPERTVVLMVERSTVKPTGD
jgi:dTDP-4-dehydrorhamnose 3,5-epimerase-like enzyme